MYVGNKWGKKERETRTKMELRMKNTVSHIFSSSPSSSFHSISYISLSFNSIFIPFHSSLSHFVLTRKAEKEGEKIFTELYTFYPFIFFPFLVTLFFTIFYFYIHMLRSFLFFSTSSFPYAFHTQSFSLHGPWLREDSREWHVCSVQWGKVTKGQNISCTTSSTSIQRFTDFKFISWSSSFSSSFCGKQSTFVVITININVTQTLMWGVKMYILGNVFSFQWQS